MSRSVTLNLCASALTIVAAIALLGAKIVAGEAPPPVSATQNTAAVVHSFYDAVNLALRTGETGQLDRVVAPDLIVHGGTGGWILDREDLKRCLLAMREFAPGLQLAIEELAVAGDRAVVHLAPPDETPTEFVGLPLAATPMLWSRSDAVRIVADRIVELWSGAASLSRLETWQRVRLPAPLQPNQGLALERFTLAAGTDAELGAFNIVRAIAVVSGAVQLVTEPTLVPPRAAVVLTVGSVAVVPEGAQYSLRPDSGLPALDAVAIAFPRQRSTAPMPMAPPGEPPVDAASPDGRKTVLLELPTVPGTKPRHAPPVVSFGRVTLTAGSPLTFAPAEGSVLLVVTSGSLTVETNGRMVVSRADEVGQEAVNFGADLRAGDAAIVPAYLSSSLRGGADGPAEVLVMSVLTDDPHEGGSK